MGTDALQGRLVVEQVANVDSTNSELLRRDSLLPPGCSAEAILLVAAHQSGGRGRRQRTWLSTPEASWTASFAREVRRPSNLGTLSLVAGLAVADALSAFGLAVRLKWPNDIHAFGGKAGGILCEARARGDVTRLVIGCGLNLLPPLAASGPRAPSRASGASGASGASDEPSDATSSAAADAAAAPAQPVAGLFSPGALPDRRMLAEAVGSALLQSTDRWLAEGFEPFRQAWSARDLLLSRPIRVHAAGGTLEAVALGIDNDGALLVRLTGEGAGMRRLLAEEVSVRLEPVASGRPGASQPAGTPSP